jgi:hypothetical protein
MKSAYETDRAGFQFLRLCCASKVVLLLKYRIFCDIKHLEMPLLCRSRRLAGK